MTEHTPFAVETEASHAGKNGNFSVQTDEHFAAIQSALALVSHLKKCEHCPLN